MINTTLVVGVSHSMPHLDEVLRCLDAEGVDQKRVMLELAKNRVPSQPEGPEFFRKLGSYIEKEGGILIYGDDEEILERAYARNAELCQKMRAPGISIEEWIELDYENTYDMPHSERDPHFLKIAKEQNPEIIILGRRHIPFLIEGHYSRLPTRVVYIPTNE